MFKRLVTLVLTLLLLVSCISVPADAASIYNRQKKSIYFVMDDSTSMQGTFEYDANYSLQTLIAMCDKEDSVNLYFLNSRPNNPKNLTMANKDSNMIADVRTTYPAANGGTPYDAVSVAQTELTNSVTQGDETEYWLVVLTDGGFAEGTVSDPEQDLQDFAAKPLANGTYPNVIFVSIGGFVTMTSKGTFTFIPGNNIIDAMNAAAKTISGRVEVQGTYSADNKEVTFNVPYPARNIVVLTQNNQTKIQSYKSASKLNITENYTVEYPVAGTNIDKSTVCFVKEANGSSISAGETTFTFDKPLDAANTTVLVEPAIGLVAHFYNQDGQEVNPDELRIGENAKLKFSICDSETQQPIDESVLGGNVDYSVKIDGNEYNANEIDFKVGSDTLEIDMYATLPDGYVLEAHNVYKDLLVKRDVVFSLSNNGTFKSDYSKLDEAEGICANILINGKPVTGEQLKDFKLKIKGKNYIISNFSVKKDEANGCFVIQPKAGWISPLTPKKKTYEVILTDKKGATHTATMTVEIPGARSWLPFILFLLGVYVLFCILSKKYFRWGANFTVWDDVLPSVDDSDSYPYEKRTIWKLYLYELGAMFNPRRWFEKDFRGWLHLLDFFFVPCSSQKVTMYTISRGYFENITLYAAKHGNIRVKDATMHEVDGEIESDYAIVQTNRTTFIDFNRTVQKGLLPLSTGETLATTIDDCDWYVVYKNKF